MNSISIFPYQRLTNGNASQVFDRLAPAYAALAAADQPNCDARDAIRLLAAPKIRAFADLAAEFASVVRQAVGSALTRDLATLDTERDAALALVNGAIDRGLRSTRDPVNAAANRIDVIRDLYPRLASRQRDEQTRLTEKLLRDLDTPALAADIALIPGLDAFLDALSELNTEFAQSFTNRIDERAEIITGRTAEVRARANAAATEAAAAINLISTVHAADFLTAGMNSINAILDQARLDLAARRRGRAQSAKEKGIGNGEDASF